MSYQGAERRIHRVVVTRNTEYHVRRNRCVRVRDLRTMQWYRVHPAIGQRLACVLTHAEGLPRTRDPEVGDALCFEGAVLTSSVTDVARPPREVVETYPAEDAEAVR